MDFLRFFPSYWECHNPNRRTHIFQRGWNHQPAIYICVCGRYDYITMLYIVVYIYMYIYSVPQEDRNYGWTSLTMTYGRYDCMTIV
jgi:hypothetical protein